MLYGWTWKIRRLTIRVLPRACVSAFCCTDLMHYLHSATRASCIYNVSCKMGSVASLSSVGPSSTGAGAVDWAREG
jgi:hypothetical protein